MNAMLAIGVVLIVLIFKSSGALAAAYGIAVTGVMVIDTFNASHRGAQAMALGPLAGDPACSARWASSI